MTMKEPPKLNLTRSLSEFERARSLIPGGVLGIRRPYNFVEGEYPVFFEKGKGGHTIDIDGNEYIDFLCAYGPIILGYREEEIDEAVIRQIRDKGFCFSLAQSSQHELADTLRQLIPCAEMSVFVKTGSDATTYAVRVARAATGRTKVMRCGYHGWHDWCVEVKGGIPPKLYEDVFEFHYNDLQGLEDLLKKHGDQTAAIIVTPYGHPLAEPLQEPRPGFLEGVRALADRYGAVLVFDEVRTCFRMSMGGAQQVYGVTPDLATVGKAMANGYAIAATVGKAQLMRKGEKEVFISSTYFPNSDGIVASMKTIEVLQRDNVLTAIQRKGKGLMEQLAAAVARHPGACAELSGNGWMFFVTFRKDEQKTYKNRRRDFYMYSIRKGVFIQPYHHGYVAFRHTDEDLTVAARVVDEALAFVEEKYGA
ncbi:MAG: aminotransferase class III-fold pyridoxal phosphate-dependent enzyme [Sedimentisphaerales bacterium]|nr:aminotransferase class III-fold pyridoxal phosphate-dependent enzyme [Sedimentisphaerales bacterium]